MDKLLSELQQIKKMVLLIEADYNYHSGSVNLSNLKPYGSDNIWRMQGRGTGHFGSGMYFSTYKLRDKADYDKKYGSAFKDMSGLIQVGDSVYRVNMDFYKNLYRVKSNEQGKWLFNTLKELNDIFYSFLYGHGDISKRYLVVVNNLSYLGLKVPKYREFINMLKQAASDFNSMYNKTQASSSASFSTRIMEWNGYNGVNVSGVWDWDNTLHGSVIYDLNKIDGDMKSVDINTLFININKKGVIGTHDSLENRLLSNDVIYDKKQMDELNSMPLERSKVLVKRYYNWFFDFDGLRDELKKVYLQSLHTKLIEDPDMANNITDKNIKMIINYNLMKIIYDKRIIRRGESLLSYVLYAFRWEEDIIRKVISGINRELDDNEKESLEFAEETLNKLNEEVSRMRGVMWLGEAIELNLSKQARAYQKRFDANMDNLFGKNVYRLYYDLDTGKMITPTRKTPTLNLDVNISDKLRHDIDRVIADNGFVLVDFDGNKVKDEKSNQEVKLTKLLQKYDVGLLKRYTSYLDSMTRAGGEGKMYAVISRHSHDIANMGDSDHFSTCENLSGIKDIKQTMIKSTIDDGGEGYGAGVGNMIRDNSFVFYLIKEGDWNIKDPLGRFASGIYCHFTGPYYGVFNQKFKNFVIGWLTEYELKYRNERGVLKGMESYWSQSLDVLVEDAFGVLYHGRTINNMNTDIYVRELINHGRYDVLFGLFNKNKGFDVIKHIVHVLTDTIVKTISPFVVNKFPAELREMYFDLVGAELEPLYKELNVKKESDDEIVQRFIKLKDQIGKDRVLQLVNGYVFYNLIGISDEDQSLLGKYDSLLKVYRLKDPKVADRLRALIVEKMAKSNHNRVQTIKEKVLNALE